MAKLYNMAQMSVAVPPGTGPFTLSAAAVAEGVTYLTLAQAGAVNGDLASYRAYDGPQWEVGRGTVGGGGTILTRGPLKSSIGGGPINASAGTFVLIAPLGEDFSDLDAAIALKENTITPGTSAQYWSGDKSWRLLDKMAVGLSNVDNTSDLNKPVSTATQTALDLKASLDSPVFVGNPTAPTPSPGDSDTSLATTGFVAAALAAVGAGGTVTWDDVTGKPSTYPPTLPIAQSGVTNLVADLAAKEATIAAGTTAQYWRGDKAWQTLDKTAVGLSNVDNTSDANKPVSTATQTALNLKENTANKGVANGYASLDAGAKIPAVQLPSYVDDVQEFANLAAFPATGTTGIIYVAIDTNKTYRWSGTGYVEISPSPGSTDSLPEGSVNLYYTNVRASAAAPVQSVATRTGAVVLTKTDVGLANVDNTSDLNKPISTATQTALNGKEATIAAGLTTQYWRGDKSWQILDKTAVGLANVDNTSDVNKPISTATQTALNGKEPTIAGGTTAQYWRGDKAWLTLDKTAVGLANVDNTSDLNKPISTATQTALNGKEPTIASGTTTQYWSGDKSWRLLDKMAVGLSNVDNTSDANKPVSSATQTALNGKQNLDAGLTALAGLDATVGLVEQTALDVFTKRAMGVAAATSVLTRADGDGRYLTASGVSGMTAGQIPIAATATTITSSVPYGTTGNSTIVQTSAAGVLLAGVMPAHTGDVTSPAGSIVNTLATVNGNIGSFTNANITVNAKGLITAAANGTAGGGGTSVTIADTAPATPAAGDLWWDSLGTQLYIRYNDGTSSQWVVANTLNIGTPSAPLPVTSGGTGAINFPVPSWTSALGGASMLPLVNGTGAFATSPWAVGTGLLGLTAYADSTQAAYIEMGRSGNTFASPSPSPNNQILGTISFSGYTGTTWGMNKAYIRANAAELWSGTASGTSITMGTTAAGTNTTSVKLTLDGSGVLTLPSLTGGLIINRNTAAVPAPFYSGHVQLAGADNTVSTLETSAFGTQGFYFVSRRAGGTAALPTATLNGYPLHGWQFRGYSPAGWSVPRSQLEIRASENWTDTAQGTTLLLNMTPTGGTATATALTLDGSGNLTATNSITVGGTRFYIGRDGSNNFWFGGLHKDDSDIWMGVNFTGAGYPNSVQLGTLTGSFVSTNIYGNGGAHPLKIQTPTTGDCYIDLNTVRNWSIGVQGSAYKSGEFWIYDSTSGRPVIVFDVNDTVHFPGTPGGGAIYTGANVTAGSYCYMELGGERSGDGWCFIDMHATTGTDRDFDFRMGREPGVNGIAHLQQQGSGALYIDSGNINTPIQFNTVLRSNGSNAGFIFQERDASVYWYWYAQTSNAYLYYEPIGNFMRFDHSGNCVVMTNGAHGYQFGGGSWLDLSDVRLKHSVEDYTAGLTEIVRLRPVTYQLNGRAGSTDNGTVHTGFVADEVQAIMPEMVGTLKLKLDPGDTDDTELLTLNTTPLTYAMLNAIKELSAQLDAANAQIQALSAKVP